jgi:transcription elongation factor GreA
MKINDSKKYVYEIVGQIESDPSNNKISNNSPLAKSILGCSVGDTVNIYGVVSPYKIKIIKIDN